MKNPVGWIDPSKVVLIVIGAFIGGAAGAAMNLAGVGAPDGDSPKVAYCRRTMEGDPQLMAMLRMSGVTRRVEEEDAISLVCGCATHSVAPTPTLRWGKINRLKTQRIPYCIGVQQAGLDNVGPDRVSRWEIEDSRR